MDDYRYLKASIAEALIESARKQISAACSRACQVMELRLKDGHFRILIKARQGEVERIEAVINQFGGLAASPASAVDVQHFRKYAEGSVEPDIRDF